MGKALDKKAYTATATEEPDGGRRGIIFADGLGPLPLGAGSPHQPWSRSRSRSDSSSRMYQHQPGVGQTQVRADTHENDNEGRRMSIRCGVGTKGYEHKHGDHHYGDHHSNLGYRRDDNYEEMSYSGKVSDRLNRIGCGKARKD